MEVNLENIQKSTANIGKNLRKKKKDSFVNKTAKTRVHNKKINSSFRRKSIRRHKSLEPQVINDLSKDVKILKPSSSTASLGSVIYLGDYRKIPQLITLEESNDSFENQGQDKAQETVIKNKNIKSTYYLRDTSCERVINNHSTIERRETSNLLDLLNDMCVGTMNKRSTRTRTRRFKH